MPKIGGPATPEESRRASRDELADRNYRDRTGAANNASERNWSDRSGANFGKLSGAGGDGALDLERNRKGLAELDGRGRQVPFPADRIGTLSRGSEPTWFCGGISRGADSNRTSGPNRHGSAGGDACRAGRDAKNKSSQRNIPTGKRTGQWAKFRRKFLGHADP